MPGWIGSCFCFCGFVVAGSLFPFRFSACSLLSSLDGCCPLKNFATIRHTIGECHCAIDILRKFCTREKDNIIILIDKVVFGLRRARVLMKPVFARARYMIYFVPMMQLNGIYSDLTMHLFANAFVWWLRANIFHLAIHRPTKWIFGLTSIYSGIGQYQVYSLFMIT